MRGTPSGIGLIGIAWAVLAAAPAVWAGDGAYIGLEGGGNWEADQNLKQGSIPGFNALAVDDRFKPGFVGGLVTGYSTSFGLRPELEFDYRRNQIRKIVGGTSTTGFTTTDYNSTDVDGFDNTYTGFANLWYDLKAHGGFFSIVHPYIGGGVGLARADIRRFDIAGAEFIKDYATRFAYQGGAGIGFDLTHDVTMSIDWRFVETDRGNYQVSGTDETIAARYHANSAMFGVRYSFGAEPPPPPPPVEAVAEVVPAAEPPPPPPPVDSDGDGVTDDLDKCPDTPPGFKVDAVGCIIEQTVVLRGINFEFNKDDLTAPAQETLDHVAMALSHQPSLSVQIGGYTDSKGSRAYNLRLSDRRAASVRHYLSGKGVPNGNLVSKGYGASNPIASNDTDEGRAENRRVEFKVLNKPSTVKVVSKDSTDASKAAAESGESGHKARRHHHHKHTAPAAADPTAAPAPAPTP